MPATTDKSPVAIVTGASSGIGRALAVRLGAEGYRVGLTARRSAEIEAVALEIVANGGRAAAHPADVGDRSSIRSAVRAIEEELGPADVLIANAGFGAATTLDPLNLPEVEETFRVNLMGVVLSIDAVLPGMLARGRGHLVAVSSLAAFKGLPGEAAYCASKSAVNAWMESLRISLRPRGIAVTTICPGFVKTPMMTMDSAATPFVMTAEAAARRIARVVARRRPGSSDSPEGWPG